MGPLWLLPGGLCVCVRKRAGAKSAHMHVCVFHRSGGWCCRRGGGGGEIYLSEQRRIGDGEERERAREERDVLGKGGGKNRKKANAEKGDLLWSEDGAY